MESDLSASTDVVEQEEKKLLHQYHLQCSTRSLERCEKEDNKVSMFFMLPNHEFFVLDAR